jgi:hypothetical protein
MLVSFSFSNFKSFKDENTISFVAELDDVRHDYSMPTPFDYSVLKTAAVYGANASGKSKLFEALAFMRDVVCPPHESANLPIFNFWKRRYDAFRLSTETANASSFFEIVFIHDNIQYRYGIELNANGIVEEWLYRKYERETIILSRKASGNEGLSTKVVKTYINAKIYNNVTSAGMISPDVPLLTILCLFNDQLSKALVEEISHIRVISANETIPPIDAIKNEESRKEIVNFMRAFDFNIEDFSMHEISLDDIPDKIKSIIGDNELKNPLYDGVVTTHRLYNESFERVGMRQFLMEADESFGTNRLLRMSWPILQTLKYGGTLFIDEIDSGLHQFIVSKIIGMFYKTTNHAQLIINTQNTSLLAQPIEENMKDRLLFRKDQIYVVNKNRYGESNVYPITHFQRNIRRNVERMYLDGMFTGIPSISDDKVNDLIGHEQQM